MIKKTILPNGLRIISEYMPESYSATVMVFVNIGSGHEPARLNGISHFIEHMLFKGTRKRNSEEIVQAIESTGGSINAFTEKECTCYYAKVLTYDVSTAIDVLLDMAFNSVYSKNDIEIERQVILEEIRMYDDTPDELVQDLLMESYWKKTALSQPIAGKIKTLQGIATEDILQFINDYYVPENIILSIAGNFNEEEVMAQISEFAGDINRSTKPKNIELPEINPGIVSCEKDIEQSHICMGLRGISILEEDRYASALIDICLGGGMASRLFQEIREKRGLVYTINSFINLYRPSGIFGVSAGTNPSHVNEVIELIMEEMQRLRSSGLTDEEFNKAKIQLKGNLMIGLESTKYRASKNGRSELYFNRTYTMNEICKSIDAVSNEDIKRLCNYMFDEKYLGVSLVGPKGYKLKELKLSGLREG